MAALDITVDLGCDLCTLMEKSRCRPTIVRKQQIRGFMFLVFGLAFFGAFFYAAVISKLMAPSHNPAISAIQRDRYYCFLVPLSLPILVVAVYFHWLNMKLFKHA
ncbi:CRISPR-associated protein Cas1 1 [Bienertia sinuspersici]